MKYVHFENKSNHKKVTFKNKFKQIDKKLNHTNCMGKYKHNVTNCILL